MHFDFNVRSLRQPKVEPLHNSPVALLLNIPFIRIVQVAPHCKPVTNSLEKLDLILLPPLLEDPHSLLPLLWRERMIVLRAREEERFVQLLELVVFQGARMRKRACCDEAFSCQAVQHVWSTKAVANAGVLGGIFAIGCRNGFGPFWDRGSSEADVLVAPGCLVEARICGLVVFVFAVLPYWIL